MKKNNFILEFNKTVYNLYIKVKIITKKYD